MINSNLAQLTTESRPQAPRVRARRNGPLKRQRSLRVVPRISEQFDQTESLTQIASLTQTASAELIEELVTLHWIQAIKIARSLLKKWRIFLPEDEINSVVGVALCEAAGRYDERKGASFPTFLYYYIKGMLVREVTARTSDSQRNSVLNDEGPQWSKSSAEFMANGTHELVCFNTPEAACEKQEIVELCQRACADLPELEREIITRHFVHEHTVIAIAKDLNYSRSHVSRVKAQALARLERLLRKWDA